MRDGLIVYKPPHQILVNISKIASAIGFCEDILEQSESNPAVARARIKLIEAYTALLDLHNDLQEIRNDHKHQ